MPVTLSEAIVRRRCAALIPYARNARTHSDQQVAQIAASIREFGFTNPVLIDEEDGIIAGNGRVLAAHLLGLDEVRNGRGRLDAQRTDRHRTRRNEAAPHADAAGVPSFLMQPESLPF